MPETRISLYWSWSFNPQKVRLALEELALPYDLRAVDLQHGEQKSPPILRLNPNGQIPIIVSDGFVLWESNAILLYLGGLAKRLMPGGAEEQADLHRWLFYESRHLSQPIGNIWFNTFVAPQFGRQPDKSAMAGVARSAQMLAPLLDLIERRLTGRAWMLGETFSILDCCYAPVLDALSLSSFDLAPFPSLCRYLSENRQRPAWKACEFR